MMFITRLPLLLLAVLLSTNFVSCGGKLKGEFAVKTAFDDAYRKPQLNPEFNSLEEIQWVYSFQGATPRRNISVIIQKKEAMWVETAAYSDYIGEEKSILQGIIHNYPAGNYRIVIMETVKNQLIDEIEFSVYSDEDND